VDGMACVFPLGTLLPLKASIQSYERTPEPFTLFSLEGARFAVRHGGSGAFSRTMDRSAPMGTESGL
jgi:hypothetical protein